MAAVSKADSGVAFWKQVEAISSLAREDGPIVIHGKEIFPNLKEATREMALSCRQTSLYVDKYLIRSDLKGTVLDLGCGIGANSIPLFLNGWHVIAIDHQLEALHQYENRVHRSAMGAGIKRLTLCNENVTTYQYPENVDAVICVDVLSYLPSTQLQTTMNKIFQALRPGGQFVGTLFLKSAQQENPLTELMGKLGAHFYPGKEFVQEILTRSGFQLTKSQERPDGYAWEFLAEKPAK